MDSKLADAIIKLSQAQNELLALLKESNSENLEETASLQTKTAQSLLFGKQKPAKIVDQPETTTQQVLFRRFEIKIRKEDSTPAQYSNSTAMLIASMNASNLWKNKEEIDQEKAAALEPYLKKGWRIKTIEQEYSSAAQMWTLQVVFTKN